MELAGKLKIILDFLSVYDIIISTTQYVVCNIF